MSLQKPQLGVTIPHEPECRLRRRANSVTVATLTCLLVAAPSLFGGGAHAQTCAITTIKDTAPLVYPALARAAHIQGTVVLVATFQADGRVSKITSITGPEWLKAASTTYVRGLQTNLSTGPRQCPLVVSFQLQAGPMSCPTDLLAFIPSFRRIDLQHVVLSGRDACIETKTTASSQSQ